MLLLMAIVTYLTRGQMKAGVMSSMESIASRSAKLQTEISNKQLANWLAKNQNRLLIEPELQIKTATPLKKAEPELPPSDASHGENHCSGAEEAREPARCSGQGHGRAMDCRRPRSGRHTGPGAFETAQRRSNRRTLRLLYQRCVQGV